MQAFSDCVFLFQNNENSLSIVVKKGLTQVADLLLSKGADVNSTDKVSTYHYNYALYTGNQILEIDHFVTC